MTINIKEQNIAVILQYFTIFDFVIYCKILKNALVAFYIFNNSG